MASQTFPPILQGEPHRPKGDLISENLVRQTKLSVRQYSSGQGVWLNKAINWERRSNSHLGSRMGGVFWGGGRVLMVRPLRARRKALEHLISAPWLHHANCKPARARPAVSFLVSSPPKTGKKKKKSIWEARTQETPNLGGGSERYPPGLRALITPLSAKWCKCYFFKLI